jgi:hypothetical protein
VPGEDNEDGKEPPGTIDAGKSQVRGPRGPTHAPANLTSSSFHCRAYSHAQSSTIVNDHDGSDVLDMLAKKSGIVLIRQKYRKPRSQVQHSLGQEKLSRGKTTTQPLEFQFPAPGEQVRSAWTPHYCRWTPRCLLSLVVEWDATADRIAGEIRLLPGLGADH